jgi:hypothetical protein
MEDKALDFGSDCVGSEDIFVKDEEFTCMQQLKKATDLGSLGSLDPPMKINPEVPRSSRGPSFNVKGDHPLSIIKSIQLSGFVPKEKVVGLKGSFPISDLHAVDLEKKDPSEDNREDDNLSLSSIGQTTKVHKKEQKERRRMVVGDDVGASYISKMLIKQLCVSFVGKSFPLQIIKGWLESNWKPMLCYLPIFTPLTEVGSVLCSVHMRT